MTKSQRAWVTAFALIAANPTASASAQNHAGSLTGSWVGVYQQYPQLIRMGVQITSASPQGALEGELRLEPLVETRMAGRGPAGVVRMTGQYDAASRTVTLTPAPDAYRLVGAQVPAFFGVLDEEKQLFGGVLVRGSRDASPYFVLGRSDRAESLFLKKLREAAEVRGGGQVGPRLFGGGPKTDKLKDWAGKLLAEYPAVDPYHTEQGTLYLMARNLFRDEYFRPFFGKTYDELSGTTVARIRGELQKTPAPRGNFPEERINGALRSLDRPFLMMTGTYSTPDITLSVMALRPIETWLTQSPRRFEQLPSTMSSLGTIGGVEYGAQQILVALWPSEQQAFTRAVTAARTRIAGPVLASSVDALVRTSTSFSDWPHVSQALSDPLPPPVVAVPVVDSSIPGLMALVSDDLRQTQRARLESHLNALVTAEATHDRAAIARLGAGLEGLDAGGQQFRAIEVKYGRLMQHPATRPLREDLAQQRAPIFRSNTSALRTQLQGALTTTQLHAVATRYLSVPSDAADPVGSTLRREADQRMATLRQTEAAAAQVAKVAKRLNDSPCSSASSAKDGQAPTERDMCWAVERSLLGTVLVDKVGDACNENTVRDANANPFFLFACGVKLMGGVQLWLLEFRKIGCASGAPAGRPGFFCDYYLRTDTNNEMAKPLFRLIGERTTARFVHSGTGWDFEIVR